MAKPSIEYVPLIAHFDSLRKSESDKNAEIMRAWLAFMHERDRRYGEVAVEREKALKIKEEADQRALVLGAEIQSYKDEKANELREQINSERNLYATTKDLRALDEALANRIKPALDFIQSTGGHRSGTAEANEWYGRLAALAIGAATFWAIHH